MYRSVKNNLAIIVPVFKTYFLEQLLESLVKQTDKRFNVYIGNDASPQDVLTIIKKFENILPIVYHRFDNNLGSTNLVGHWHRSIDLTKGEEWLWLFGDDDIMDADCVKDFYNNVNDTNHVYRFSTRCMNEKGEKIKRRQIVKSLQNRSDYLRDRLLEKHRISLGECIFSRQSFIKSGGFLEMPLAFSSDVVAWYDFSGMNGIKGINSSSVYLRTSRYNISSRKDNVDQKRFAMDNVFYKWVEKNEPTIYKSTMSDRKFINDIRIMLCNGKRFFQILKFVFDLSYDVTNFTRFRGLKILIYKKLTFFRKG
jgi:glycosyltransferase involved in cell wall biosynthesis